MPVTLQQQPLITLGAIWLIVYNFYLPQRRMHYVHQCCYHAATIFPFAMLTSQWYHFGLLWLAMCGLRFIRQLLLGKSQYLDVYYHIAQLVAVGSLLYQAVPSQADYPTYRVLLFFLLIGKPVNVWFKMLYKKYQPPTDYDDAETLMIDGAGAVIGILERVAMGILLLYGQFAALGLVLTAKSIARYERISKQPAFAEYYLIGSLFSIISVLIAYSLVIA